MFKRIVMLCAASALVVFGLASISTPAQAAPSPKANQLTCFTDDTGSECIRNGSDSFTLINDAGEGSGVYVENQTLAGKPISEASVLTFSYVGDTSGGSPRFAIPLDIPNYGDTIYDGFLFADINHCDANQDGTVSLAEPGCVIEAPGGYFGTFADYVAAHPDYKIGSYYTFIVADQPGTVTVYDIKLARKAPGKGKN